MSKFTKEQLINWADRLIEETYSDIEISRTDAHAESYHAQLSLLQLARTALTSSMEQEPVGEVVLGDYDDCGDHPDAKVVCIAAQGQAEWSNFSNGTKLYAAPQLPQPTVPDELTREEYRRRFMMEDNFNDTYRGGWNACRAAMLKSFGNSEQLDEVGSWDNHMNTPAAKPAINTDELLKHIEGMEVSVDVSTCDADAGHRYFGTVTEISELDTARNGYILLVQDAKPNFKPAGNSPATPDGYVLVPIEPTMAMLDEFDSIIDHGAEDSKDAWSRLIAAAPQQEVK